MTTQNAIDIFSVLQDKYGSPNIDDDDILGHLNMAMFEWLNRLSPDNQGGVVNFEYDTNVIHNIRPLIYTFTGNMDSNGMLLNATINTALQTESSDTSATVFRVMSIGITDSQGNTYPIKYTRQNNIYAYLRNRFKRPSVTNPRVTLLAKGYKFYPTNQTNTITITVIKNPKALALSPLSNPELDDYCMYQVIALALKLGGVETRDDELIVDVRNTGLQIMN